MLLGHIARLAIGLLAFGFIAMMVFVFWTVVMRRKENELGTPRWFAMIGLDSFLLIGFMAFAALSANAAVTNEPVPGIVFAYGAGFVACFLAYAINGLSWGSMANLYFLIASLVSYIVFCIFPQVARVLYGWAFVAVGI